MPRVTLLEHAKRDDDLLSYFFIDLGLYRDRKEISRKMQREHFKIPNENWEPLLDILEEVKSGDLDPRDAANTLLRKAPIRTLLDRKRNDPERQHLIGHVNRYLEIWKPDCDFRIFATERYKWKGTRSFQKRMAELQACTAPATSVTTTQPATNDVLPPLDLGVKANRDFEVNEYIKLYGSAADLTDEQDDEMRMETSQLKADFSVLWNNTRNCFQIFMGPGRFVNHDCNNNVELTRSGKSLCFKVVRPIKKGQEIFTFYGEEYFGEKNCDCRCFTCQSAGKGWYSQMEDDELPSNTRVQRKEATAAEVRKTRSGRMLDGGESDASSRATSQQGNTRSKRSRPSTLGHGSGKTKATKRAKKRATTSDSEGESDQSEYQLIRSTVRRPKTVRPSKGKAKGKGRYAPASSSDLSELDDESDLTDLDELEGRKEEVYGIFVNGKTGTLSDPHTSQATGLPPTSTNVKLLSATIAVAVDNDMPSPMTPDSALTPALASPEPQEASKTASLSKSLMDKMTSLARVAFPYAAPASPGTETSDSLSQSQAEAA